MRSTWLRRAGVAVVTAVLASGCSDFTRQSGSPSQLVIDGIQTATGTGGVPTTFAAGPLLSDVVTDQTVYDDFGQVSLRAILRDPGPPGSPTSASSLNNVTITRYTVTYSRAGGPIGNNTPGVDVPHPIDGAVTLTVPINSSVPSVTVVELVRHVAKLEAPLVALVSAPEVLTMIATVTFYGRDQAGNNLSATGAVQVDFGNFN